MPKKHVLIPTSCFFLLYKTSMLIRKKYFKLISSNEKKILHHTQKKVALVLWTFSE